MSMDGEDEAFDEEDLSEGFVEGSIEDLEGDDVVEELDDALGDEEPLEDGDDAEGDPLPVVAEVVVVEDDDLVDDADVELALDEVLAETIRRTSVPEDDDDAPVEVDPTVDAIETILPKQDDEFRCKSCRLLKKMSQLADANKTLCRDCV